MSVITQIWHQAKFYFTCISGLWYLIMVSNMKKISSHHRGMYEDGSYIPRFTLGGAGNITLYMYNAHYSLCDNSLNLLLPLQ